MEERGRENGRGVRHLTTITTDIAYNADRGPLSKDDNSIIKNTLLFYVESAMKILKSKKL